ncbi:ribosomal biogenesis protein LAS1 [Sarotherodon galilaeus]
MEQEGCDTEAVEQQQEAFEEQESLQEPCTSKAAKEGSLRKSQRVTKFTERGQALHDEKVNKLQAHFKVSYELWKVIAKQGKKVGSSAEVKKVYDELRNHETPDADTCRRVDTCDAVSQKMIKLAREKLAAEEDEELSERLVHWSDTGSAFNSATSQRSKSSNSRQSRFSSKLSVERQEAAAELAATEAKRHLKAENAEKQKALEQKRRQLERLETVKRMNAAKARLKVYRVGHLYGYTVIKWEWLVILKSCLWHIKGNSDEEISDLLHERSKRRNATSKPMNQFPQATSRSQPRESKQEDSTTTLAQALAESIHISCLPVPEPTDWKMSFQMLIDRKNIPVNEKIYYLRKYVGGPARACLLLSMEHFGGKIRKIGNKDSVELQEFSDFLRGCEAAMLQVKGVEVLNDRNENQRMLSKLPDWLTARWNWKPFVDFIVREAKIACNPVTSLHALKAGDSEKTKSTKTRSVGAKVLVSAEEEASNTKKCVFCENPNHSIHTCRKFMDKVLSERVKFVQTKGLCFGCLGFGHQSKKCEKRKMCDTCKGKHLTCLHEERDKNSRKRKVTRNHK